MKPAEAISVLNEKSPISSRVPVESGSANAGPAADRLRRPIETDIAARRRARDLEAILRREN